MPICNLFTQHVIYLYGETPLVNCGPQSCFLYIDIQPNQLCLLPAITVLYITANISFHTIQLILCIQQTGEIDNLTESLGAKYFGCVVCRFHVVADAINLFSGAVAKSASNTFRSDSLLLLVRLNLGFLLRENVTPPILRRL